jgi:hypothetical protein
MQPGHVRLAVYAREPNDQPGIFNLDNVKNALSKGYTELFENHALEDQHSDVRKFRITRE